jgi:uncharacterized protein (DUF1800 family)
MLSADSHRKLVAHLFRRAGFGATPAELDSYALRSYEEIVEDLLHPERFPDVEDDVLRRYFLELNNADTVGMWQAHWVYRMVNTLRPLEEKIALFWHQIFATSLGKSEHGPSAVFQIETFRRDGLGDLRKIYLDVATDPAMLFWLDNCENHNGAPNENWGRELLELFSMGVGNYTEDDIKNASRAFTGWTFTQPLPLDPYGRYSSEFFFQAGDHDGSEKTFLGETGQFDGQDIIDIVIKQPATARFISRHLYNFFVADEPQVPAWNIVPPKDPKAIESLVEASSVSGGNMRSILRTLFNSDFFKEARFQRIKSPAELVAGTVKLAGGHRFPDPGLETLAGATAAMGQMLMVPPTVEGWHTGKEWIDAGTLNERVNFAVNQLSDVSTPGIRSLIDQIAADGSVMSAEQFVDRCLDWLGPLTVSDDTRRELVQYADAGGELRFDSEHARNENSARLIRVLQTAVSSVEYQFA